MKRILIVEDEKHLAEGLAFNLDAEGYSAEIASDGEQALEMAGDRDYDALVLDIMLPGIDGFEVARRLRAKGDHIPILMLTARGRPEDVLLGFEAGTDDYIPKPFDLPIFFARLNGLLRRAGWQGSDSSSAELPETAEINGRKIDFRNLELTSGGETTHLTLMEAKLLAHLFANAGRAISRKEILDEVWGLHEDTDTRAIDNFIVRLRRHLETDPSNPEVLLTVRGVGYRFERPS